MLIKKEHLIGVNYKTKVQGNKQGLLVIACMDWLLVVA